MKYYRLMTSLPPVKGDLKSTSIPSLSKITHQIFSEVGGRDKDLVSSILWFVDTANAEAILFEKDFFRKSGTLSREDFENKLDLPPFLDNIFRMEQGVVQKEILLKKLWESYFNALIEISRKYNSKFLQGYTEMEIGLRNAVAAARAKKLGIEEGKIQIFNGKNSFQYGSLVLRASEAKDPQERELVIDKARLAYYLELEGIDPFSIDAVLAYLAKAMVIDSWKTEKDADIEKMLEVFA
ncbi:MAG: DUF2764 family protein [Deltaproteobacteria bacterium]|nr:DUF2764 family protein [Deltaproteobacteria bacterium]